MSSQFETGHVKNVANLLKYNQYLATLGASYNPPAPAISLAALNTLYTEAAARLEALKQAEDVWKTDTNNREVAFNNLGAFTTRLLGVLRSTSVSQQTITDLAALVAKMRGGSKKAALPKTSEPAATDGVTLAPEAAVTRSSSRQSFDQRMDTFSKIVILLQGVAGYTPNEPELSIAGLQAQNAQLIELNTKANTADANLKAARNERNKFLYAPETGMLDLVKKSKAYVIGLYGRSSSEYKTALTYKFSKFKE